MGVHRIEPGETKFNTRNTSVMLMFGCYIILTIKNILFDINSHRQYAESFFALTTSSCVCAGYVILVLRTVIIFQFHDKVEGFYDKRK